MTKIRLGYFIKEGMSNIFSHGFMSFASIFIIMACLIIMGSFSLLALNMHNIIRTLEKQNQIAVFIDDELTLEQAKALETEIRLVPNVANVYFITRDEALESFLKQYDDNKLFQDLTPDILRHRYLITLDDIGLMEQTRDDLRSIDGVAKVRVHLEISRGFVTLRNIVSVVSAVLVLLLFIVSVFIMSNTIKLTTFHRREEIAIMRMVGATSSFIRWPFVFEGIIMGLLGSLLAFLVQWAMYYLAVIRMDASTSLSFITLISTGNIVIPMLATFLSVGILVGVGGSVFAIKNYLKL